jgi:hypothetical protein
MKCRLKPVAIVGSFIKNFLVFIIVALALSGAFIWSFKIPSDNQVQERFNRDRAPLTVLLNMLSREPSKIIGVTKHDVMIDYPSKWVIPDKAGFSEEHFAEYKTLMDKAHIIQIFRWDGEVNFAFAGWGVAGSGWRLSFAYIITPPSPLVKSIDSPPKVSSPDGRTIAYRSLGHNWYIRLIFEG